MPVTAIITYVIKYTNLFWQIIAKLRIVKFVQIIIVPKIENKCPETKTIAIIKDGDKLPELTIDMSIRVGKNVSSYLERKNLIIKVTFILDNIDLLVDGEDSIVIKSSNSKTLSTNGKHTLIVEKDKNNFKNKKNTGLSILSNIYDSEGNNKNHRGLLKVNAHIDLGSNVLTNDIHIILID